tara:strand:+ start:163 stop:555 length:393 start_codon:yes stop_codon:yes gene_type:complete
MELDMKKDIKSTDKISEGTLHEILLDIKYRLDHLEDIEADNRALIVKLIKQSNSIVKFLASIDMEVQDVNYEEMMGLPKINENKTINSNRMKHLKELVEEYMDKAKDLKEFEKELKKHKDKVTPGQVGES